MVNNANLDLLPDRFGSADQAVLAVTASVDLNSDVMLGGYIVFSREHEHYRISRPASTGEYPRVEFNDRGILSVNSDFKFCGTYCTADTAGARRLAIEHGEQALYRNFFAPACLARMIRQDLSLRACAGYWLAPDSAVLKFRSHGDEKAYELMAQPSRIEDALISETRSMSSFIQQVAKAGDLLVLRTSHFPGLWASLGAVPVDWLAPVQAN